MKRILVTGPVDALAEYADAARAAGWQAIAHPLLEIVERDVDAELVVAGDLEFDWIVVASAHALPFLARALSARPDLARVPCACVGARTAQRASEVGLARGLEVTKGREELAQRLLKRSRDPKRALCPRGDRSDELAQLLRAAGWTVVDPIVYDTRDAAARELPAAEAIFVTSSSAVRALEALGSFAVPSHAIALGERTYLELVAADLGGITSVDVLDEPTPDALRRHLLRDAGGGA